MNLERIQIKRHTWFYGSGSLGNQEGHGYQNHMIWDWIRQFELDWWENDSNRLLESQASCIYDSYVNHTTQYSIACIIRFVRYNVRAGIWNGNDKLRKFTCSLFLYFPNFHFRLDILGLKKALESYYDRFHCTLGLYVYKRAEKTMEWTDILVKL